MRMPNYKVLREDSYQDRFQEHFTLIIDHARIHLVNFVQRLVVLNEIPLHFLAIHYL